MGFIVLVVCGVLFVWSIVRASKRAEKEAVANRDLAWSLRRNEEHWDWIKSEWNKGRITDEEYARNGGPAAAEWYAVKQEQDKILSTNMTRKFSRFAPSVRTLFVLARAHDDISGLGNTSAFAKFRDLVGDKSLSDVGAVKALNPALIAEEYGILCGSVGAMIFTRKNTSWSGALFVDPDDVERSLRMAAGADRRDAERNNAWLKGVA